MAAIALAAVATAPSARCPGPFAGVDIAADVAASLAAELRRQIKPFWKPPEGTGRLRTRLRLRFSRDGALVGEPALVSQEGIAEVSDALAQEHARRAIKAVYRAAPFRLPVQYYAIWCSVDIQFDARLDQ
ncbi:hypothetical protein [Stakelama tenebrarum]|uniref:TonB C-terminal domain-containing protein n=1 Tax=Stakelama tenebrarum TaxID=2711215 RepID=A0A6G6Y8X3_9SPHN|nr:hypothetical protein [Sphingosinithalassobacter tenebrarum]QIG81384.1 hypothetical protein G5C33_17385 [Sphingosinithalassobacter tenebrarum]